MVKHAFSNQNFNSSTEKLSDQEIYNYFKFLTDMDDRFKQFYVDFPDKFKLFAKCSEFVKLKSFLGEKYNERVEYNRNTLYYKQKFIDKMYCLLADTISEPHKKPKIEEKITVNNWIMAFKYCLNTISVRTTEKKLEFKQKIKSYSETL